MPLNLLKVYNDLLELNHAAIHERLKSLRGVFNRDFSQFPILFRGYNIQPTPSDTEDTFDRVFRHLTTVVVNENTRKREFELERSVRLHWVRFHLEERKADVIRVFTVVNENRVYILDKEERYVIVLEPMRSVKAFFLLTAYHLEDSRYRNLMKKYKKRGKAGITVW